MNEETILKKLEEYSTSVGRGIIIRSQKDWEELREMIKGNNRLSMASTDFNFYQQELKSNSMVVFLSGGYTSDIEYCIRQQITLRDYTSFSKDFYIYKEELIKLL